MSACCYFLICLTQTTNSGRLPKNQITQSGDGLRERLEAVIALYSGYCGALYSLRNMLVSSRNNTGDRFIYVVLLAS